MLTGNRIPSQPVITIEETPEKSLSRMTNDAIATLGIDVAANVFHLIRLGPIAGTSPYLIGLEADVGVYHVGRI
jgi:hypothetical protein